MQCQDTISIILPEKPKVGIYGTIARKKSERPKYISINMRSIPTKDNSADGKV